MRIFQEIELPPTCYAPEVAFWLAVARVPKTLVMASEFGEDFTAYDPRTNRLALDENNRVLPYDVGFSQAELHHIGQNIDYGRYVRTKALVAKYPYLPPRASGDEVVAAELRHLHMLNILLEERDPERKVPIPSEDAMQLVREGVDWMNSIDAQCEVTIDLARTEVFRALARGQLKAKAWREEPGELHHVGGEDEATWVDVPADHWTLRNVDWDQSSLQHSSGGYFAVQVSTADMLQVFPKPGCPAVVLSLETFPGCILMDDDSNSGTVPAPKPARRVGRPNKGDELSLKTIVLNYFRDQVLSSDETKREALVAEAMEFAKKTSRQTVGRSTVQGWFKELRTSMPEIMPTMYAEK